MDLDAWGDQESKQIIEFLEVAIHNVAYTRHLYPSSSFASKQKYGIPIRICTHPGVSAYIKNCLKVVEKLFNTSEIESAHLVLVTENLEPLESFVFDFSNSNTSMYLQDFLLRESIELFQAFCLKLGASHSHLSPYSLNTSFQIDISTTTAPQKLMLLNSENPKFSWRETARATGKRDPSEAKISPVESFHTPFLSAHNVIYTRDS